MSRPARLLNLVQALRRRRHPVRAAELASELGVSLRTVYRDIASLVAEGAPIEGVAGLGYVLRQGFFLPPLMFSEDELDALILGLRLAAGRGDPDLEKAADDALAKIVAVLPAEHEDVAATSGLRVGGSPEPQPHLAMIRLAIRNEQKLRLAYLDKRERATARTVWPVAIGFFEAVEVLAAWCELRQDFRHFRLDRIGDAQPTGDRYPRRRRLLLADWRLRQELD